MGTAMSGWTSGATTGVAFAPFSSGAAPLRGAGSMVLNMLWMDTVKKRTWLGASTASPTHFGTETYWLVSGAFGHPCYTLGTLGCGCRLRPGPMEIEEGWLLPHHPWLMLPWAPQGQVGAGALVLHP